MQTETQPYQPVHHVFVDFENVRSIDTGVLEGKHVRLNLFLGPQNHKLDVEVVEKLLEHAQAVQLIRSRVTTKNGLDFVLAYHLGQAVLADPKGWFHIVAKDKGYEALVDLLKSRNLKIKKHADWSGLCLQSASKPVAQAVPPTVAATKVQKVAKAQPATKASAAAALSATAAKLMENLKKLPASKRPKKEKGLIAHAKGLCGKDADGTKVEETLKELKKSKHITTDAKGAVTYQL